MHHLLDDYYLARLKTLFKEARTKNDKKSVEDLCQFLFKDSTKFYLRNENTYYLFSPLIVNGTDFVPAAVELLLKSKEHLVGLELAAT